MKFIYFTDPHVRITSPKYRKDDFYQTILKKLSYVNYLGQEYNVDSYICGGDWMDRPDIPYTTLTGLAEVLSKFKKPIYSVIGNHDIFGYNPETHYRTALSVIRGCGFITRLSMQQPICVTDGNTRVLLSGCDAHSQLDKNGRITDYIDIPGEDIEADARIHVVHGFLTKKPWPHVPVTTINQILDTKADIVLTGHEHSGFGVIKANGKLFCNPGALGRITASVGDVNLEVKVALIEINGSDRKIDLIKLPADIARPASEVIDRDAMEKEKARQETLMLYSTATKETVNKFKFDTGFDLYRMLDMLKENKHIPEDVEAIMLKYIALAEEEAKKGEEEG
jgi:DNA repair exonuclease SbcCD nuclease subunit